MIFYFIQSNPNITIYVLQLLHEISNVLCLKNSNWVLPEWMPFYVALFTIQNSKPFTVFCLQLLYSPPVISHNTLALSSAELCTNHILLHLVLFRFYFNRFPKWRLYLATFRGHFSAKLSPNYNSLKHTHTHKHKLW